MYEAVSNQLDLSIVRVKGGRGDRGPLLLDLVLLAYIYSLFIVMSVRKYGDGGDTGSGFLAEGGH